MFLFFIIDIKLYNPINLIHTTNKLTRLNYKDWKMNLDILLIWKELKWVIQEFALFLFMNIPLKKRPIHIILGKRRIKRPSVRYLGLWITCNNINMCLCQQFMIFFSIFMRYFMVRVSQLDKLLLRLSWMLRCHKKLSLEIIWFV